MNPNGKALLKENKRYYLLDSLRGISTVSMVAFHLCYDIFMMYGLNTSWYFYPMTAVWERSICVMFILLSGMCLNFSGNGIKRGVLLNLAGFAVTCVTVIAEPNQAVWFGVLNLIGCSMMIVSVLSDNLKKISPLSGALISLLLYAVSYDLQKGCVGFFGLDIVKFWDSPRPTLCRQTISRLFRGFSSLRQAFIFGISSHKKILQNILNSKSRCLTKSANTACGFILPTSLLLWVF